VKPRKDWTSLMVRGTGQSSIARILEGSMESISHIFNNVNMELTFFRICEESIFSTPEKDFVNLRDVFFKMIRFCVNDEIVEIHGDKLVKEVMEGVVHEILEGCGHISETKMHN
jgi:hypothetical protein